MPSASEHRVHIDTLSYTREGLATREPIPLSVGTHNRVILVRPDRADRADRAHLTTLAGFGYDRAFPGAPLAALLGNRAAVSKLTALA